MVGWAVPKDVWANYWLDLFEKRESIVEMTVNTLLPSSSPGAEWVSKQSSVRYMEWNNCLSRGGQEGIQITNFSGFWTRSCGWLKCVWEFWSSWRSSRANVWEGRVRTSSKMFSLCGLTFKLKYLISLKKTHVWAEERKEFHLPESLTENVPYYSSCLEFPVVLKP